MNRLLISEEAFWDIKEAIEYYARISSENTANRFREQLEKALDYITLKPLSLALKYKMVRTFNLKRFPYQIHFIYKEEQVMVMGVFHAKSNPESWEDRLEY